MKYVFGKNQIDCIAHRLELGDSFEEIYLDSYDGEPVKVSDKMILATPNFSLEELIEAHDILQRKAFTWRAKSATLDTSVLTTDNLRRAAKWIIDDCIDGSTWFDIVAYDEDSPFLDRWGQLNESALYRFRETLEDKVADIDWGITDGLEPVTKVEVKA
tara:strand:- start:266 stop:742 length:477 start_codon:yes stop_codon:yes gene_type:complete